MTQDDNALPPRRPVVGKSFMTDTPPPCPVCGVDNSYLDGRHRTCRTCGFNVLGGEWNRLARAVALLGACEAAEGDVTSIRRTDSNEWAVWRVNGRPLYAPTLAAALVALAEAVGGGK